MEEMNKFVDLVDRMMQMQAKYYSTDRNSSKKGEYLRESKKLEKEVRDYVSNYKNRGNQINLF